MGNKHMDKNTVAVTVTILDREYAVSCPRGQEMALLDSAKRVDKEMRKVRDSGKVFGIDRIGVMVSLNLAYELLQCQQGVSPGEQDAQTGERLQKLQADMTSALKLYRPTQPMTTNDG